MGDRALIANFMKQHDLGVLSTVSDEGKSESAVVGFSVNDTLELTVGTSADSRKYANMVRNPTVSVVIGWDQNITVQYEGTARPLEGSELQALQKAHFAKQPDAAKYAEEPTERYMAISPTWIRYTDCNHEPWVIRELVFPPS